MIGDTFWQYLKKLGNFLSHYLVTLMITVKYVRLAVPSGKNPQCEVCQKCIVLIISVFLLCSFSRNRGLVDFWITFQSFRQKENESSVPRHRRRHRRRRRHEISSNDTSSNPERDILGDIGDAYLMLPYNMVKSIKW